MITTNGNLYQWDTGRRIMCRPPDGLWVDEIHIDNYTRKNAIVLKVYSDDYYEGYVIADIPDVILQRGNPLSVYAVMYLDDEENTIESATIPVISRKKPDDYVYEEEEILTYKKMEQKIEELSEKIDRIDTSFSVTVDDALSETSTNPVQNRIVTTSLKAIETNIGNIDALLNTI